ncbi:MAG: CsiV family protein [Gammaproteobacteria bacterium]
MGRAAFRIAALVTAVLSTGIAPGPAGAQTGQRHYQVEVVIFSQPAGASVEQRPLRRVPEAEADLAPAQGAILDAEAPAAQSPMAGAADLDGVAPFLPRGVSGPVAPRKLEAVARRLNTGGFTLLWHQAWVQPAVARDGLELATLAALGQGPAAAELSGVIGLTAGRFLHLGLTIELHSEAGVEAVLAQRRRVRPGVEQYFDHPHIGVIALVTSVTLEPTASQPAP